MRRALLVWVVAVLCAACASTPSTAPGSPSPSQAARPSPSPATTISVDCGSVTAVSDCLAMVSAAARAVSLAAVPGVRAEVSPAGAAELRCSSCLGGNILAAASVVARVSFITPSGSEASAWVITNPIGSYAGAISMNGVTPAPAPRATESPPATIAIDCDGIGDVPDCLAMVAGAAERVTPGVRAELTKGATPDVAAVTFISSTGGRASIWVIPTPIGGGYTGAWSLNGVTPPP
jgi:hypothetical protein